jgi:hypothetical protein
MMTIAGAAAFFVLILLGTASAAIVTEKWIRGRFSLGTALGLMTNGSVLCGLLAWLLKQRPDHPWAGELTNPLYLPYLSSVVCLMTLVGGTGIRGIGWLFQYLYTSHGRKERGPSAEDHE